MPLASSARPQTPSRPSSVPTARRHGSVPGAASSSASSSRPTRPPRSKSRAAPAPAATRGRRTRAQPATSASPVSVPWPTGPSCWPQRASASRTPSVISPTAHRSRAWTRQNGGREGAGRLAREAGFLAASRAGARVEAPPRVLVTTVGPRLVPDLVVFADTRPVEMRTCVRYPSPGWHCGGPWPRARRAARSSPTSGWPSATSGRAPTPGWSSSTSTPAPSSTRCRRRASCPSGTPSTRIEAAATPACTASPGRPTTISGSASAPTSSARSWSR